MASSRPMRHGFRIPAQPLRDVREPAPVRRYFVCPVCGADHPRNDCPVLARKNDRDRRTESRS